MIIETCPECGADLFESVIATNPPIPCKHCTMCGWRWEGNMAREEIVRIPFTAPTDRCINPPFNWCGEEAIGDET